MLIFIGFCTDFNELFITEKSNDGCNYGGSNVHEYVVGSESAGVQFGVSENDLASPCASHMVHMRVHTKDTPKERYVFDYCIVVYISGY